MVQEDKNLKFRLCAALVLLAACIVLPYTAMALKALSHDELQNNSTELQTVNDKKPYDAANLPEPASTEKKPEKAKSYEVSPISVEIIPEATSREVYLHSLQSSFNRSVCHQCHNPGDINAADKTRKQWRVLIGNNGHSVFKPIPWSNPEEKSNVMRYLLEHAKNTNLHSEGIGVWR